MHALRLRLGALWERAPRSVLLATVGTVVVVTALALVAVLSVRSSEDSDPPEAATGTAQSFAVLAGTLVSNTGPSVISGDMGVSPGTSITGFPPGKMISGAEHAADLMAERAQADLTMAYNDAARRSQPTAVPPDLGGLTLAPGVYNQATALGLTGTLTLDAGNDPGAVFIFQAESTLITASSSRVDLVNGAQACNVFWQVGGTATLGAGTTFAGSVLALASVAVQSGTTVSGQLLARSGQVSLDTNIITRPTCDTSDPAGDQTPVAPEPSGSAEPTGPLPTAADPTRPRSPTAAGTTRAPAPADPTTTDPAPSTDPTITTETTTTETTTDTTTTETTTTETTTETTTTETTTSEPIIDPMPPPPD